MRIIHFSIVSLALKLFYSMKRKDFKRNVRYVRIPNRKAKTLMVVILKYCAPGSVIHIDGWRSYNALGRMGFIHSVVIHVNNYENISTGARIQGVERSWIEVRAWWRRSRGNRVNLQSHVDSIFWRLLHKDKQNSMDLLE